MEPLSMKSSLPFISSEPKVGDPPLEWADFKSPKLRRFPGAQDHIELQRFLGRGEEGIVIKAQVEGQEDPVAIKIVSQSSQRSVILSHR